MISDDLIAIKDAAKILDVSSQRIVQLLKQERIRWVPSPYGRLVSRESLLAFKDSRRQRRAGKAP